MARSQTCGLCREPLDAGSHRSCGLDVCEPCYAGDTASRVRARFEVTERQWTVQPSNDDDVPRHYVEATGVARTGIPAQARFSREGVGVRIRRFFGGARDEVQAGDQLFDDTVWVESETPDALRPLLANEGVQMVVLEGMTDFGSIRFEPAGGDTRVVVRSSWSSRSNFEPARGHARLVAIALHHLEAAAAERT